MQTFSSLIHGRYTRRMVALLCVAALTAGFVAAAKAQTPDQLPTIRSDSVSVGYLTKNMSQR